MPSTISIGFSGMFSGSPKKNTRENKGKSRVAFPSDYVVIDIETTGLDPRYDDIIEVAALKVSNGSIIDRYETLVKPECDLEDFDDFITDLTGITPEMLFNAPYFQDISDALITFLGDSLLIGHNVNFDINFLYDATRGRLVNDFVDTMRLSRRLAPELPHHRLCDVASHYGIAVDGAHRSLVDCMTTNACYVALSSDVLRQFGSHDEFSKVVKKSHAGANANDIIVNKTNFDLSHPLFNKGCVFTGVLERFIRKEAMQLVADLGGICQNSVTSKTNYLILGNNDYCPLIKDGKSSKQKKAEVLKLAGNDIEIISENVFYDLIFDE